MKREHGFPAGHPFPVPSSFPHEEDRHPAATYLGYRLSAVASHSSGGTPVVFPSTGSVRQPKNGESPCLPGSMFALFKRIDGEQRNLNDSAASGSGTSTALISSRTPARMK